MKKLLILEKLIYQIYRRRNNMIDIDQIKVDKIDQFYKHHIEYLVELNLL